MQSRRPAMSNRRWGALYSQHEVRMMMMIYIILCFMFSLYYFICFVNICDILCLYYYVSSSFPFRSASGLGNQPSPYSFSVYCRYCLKEAPHRKIAVSRIKKAPDTGSFACTHAQEGMNTFVGAVMTFFPLSSLLDCFIDASICLFHFKITKSTF